MDYEYIGNSTQLGKKFIEKLKEEGKRIVYHTFRTKILARELAKRFPEYDWFTSIDKGIKMEDDYKVSFYRTKNSKYYFLIQFKTVYVWEKK